MGFNPFATFTNAVSGVVDGAMTWGKASVNQTTSVMHGDFSHTVENGEAAAGGAFELGINGMTLSSGTGFAAACIMDGVTS